jgi:tripartite ATP-independent transporter DctP family solute receptor
MTIKIDRRTMLKMSMAAVAGAAVPGIVSAAAPIKLRVSSSAPPDKFGAHYLWYKPFEDNLKAAVGDKIQLEYFPNAMLGKEADVVQQVKAGSVDMMLTGLSIWSTVVPEIAMLDFGYIFDDYKHATRALDRGVGPAIDKMLQERTGVSVVGWGFQVGARSVYAKTEIKSLADLSGKKLRVLPVKGMIDTFNIFGATPTPIPVNEVYTAVQTGVVDGFEHDPGTVLAYKWDEVAKHCLLTRHMYSTMCAYIGKRGLSKIPADLMPAFVKAAQAATVVAREQAALVENEAFELLRAKNITFAEFAVAERDKVRLAIEQNLHTAFIKQYPTTQKLFEIVASTRSK